MHRKLTAVFAATLIPLSFSGCTKNAATGKNILTLGMSRDQEIALGSEAAPEFTKEFGGAVENPRLQKYVADIGKKMASQTEANNPTLPWEFTLLNTEVVNAFALPGGKVFFTRGLAQKLTSEAQMAGVIGHEIGHVTAQHGSQRIAQAGLTNLGVAAVAIGVGASGNEDVQRYGAIGVPALAMGGQLVLLKFGRNEELEADRLGVRYMSAVGYNPRGQMEVMQVLASLSKGGGTPAILSTHPDPGARVQAIQDLLNSEYAHTQNNPKFQDFKERYKADFLDVLATIPKPPPPPKPKPQQGAGLMDPIRLDDSASWCALCAAQAKEPRPVPPREGVYAFFAPAAAH